MTSAHQGGLVCGAVLVHGSEIHAHNTALAQRRRRQGDAHGALAAPSLRAGGALHGQDQRLLRGSAAAAEQLVAVAGLCLQAVVVVLDARQ